ncbi:polysaccharide biosynthesis C-terminal domain-containing protein [Selenomonas ruminantium]|uniref:oligosaccharide flippase family protein n=1 Tax=Selenomonas ruminantium TaxID=971 RepID=UPI00041B8CEA|nr:polysaccharide biosynthesis C-terminal domain-containing protein [Selenomonas ruminantium]
MFVLKVFAAILAFIIQVQLSGLLGIDGYGSFSLILSVANVISIFPLLGMDSGLIREVASASSLGVRKWYALVSFLCSFALLIFLGILMLPIFPYIAKVLSLPADMLLLLMSYLVLLVFNTLAGAFLQGEQRNVFNDGTLVLTLIGKLFCIYWLGIIGAGLQDVLFAYIFLEFICTVGRWSNIVFRYRHMNIERQPLVDVKRYLLYCIPLFFVSSIGIVQCSLHRFVTAFFMDNYNVGILRVCENFSAGLALFVAPFVTTWPLMAAYYKEARLDDIRKMFEESSVIITMLIMPALTFILVCAPELFQLFHLSVLDNPTLITVLFIFCLGTVYDAIIGPAGALLKMTEYSRVAFYNSAILLVLTIIFSYVLIPMFGLIGAASALSLSHFVINTMNAYQNYRFFKLMPYGRRQIELILFAVPVAGMLLYLREKVIFTPFLNIIIYGISIYFIFMIWAYIRNPVLFKKTIKR